ncbi:hypothetical protein I6B53_01430 [Schaalia sp. 19OD2882]|uniref:hypothetical protein n=1 Tax=Schaalia sp. 19OD2882 TaxID=2794089 RepID=UPI001C1F1B53|nr:hypothetical protein [Schaalia sp. 19OD2882]QWW19820.1 hypothetical protein I6B53_01430 [Schaalia sp. 19OD2882]
MSFNVGTYEATINELNLNVERVSTKSEELRTAVVSALDSPLVMDWMADLVVKASNSIVNATKALLKKVGEFLEGAAAPVLFFKRAYDWVTDVKTPMIDISDATSPSHLISTEKWKGAARDAYIQAVSDQPGAAKAIAGVGGTMATQLRIIAAAGCTFYIAVGIIVVKFISALIAGIAACGTVVLSPLGLGVIALDCGVTAAELIAAGTLLGVTLVACGASIIEMKNVLADFPGQEWPLAVKE